MENKHERTSSFNVFDICLDILANDDYYCFIRCASDKRVQDTRNIIAWDTITYSDTVVKYVQKYGYTAVNNVVLAIIDRQKEKAGAEA